MRELCRLGNIGARQTKPISAMNNTEQQIAALMQQVLVMTQELKELKERLPKPGLVWVGTKVFSEQIGSSQKTVMRMIEDGRLPENCWRQQRHGSRMKYLIHRDQALKVLNS